MRVWDEVIIWMPFKKSLESVLLWKKSMFFSQALTQILYSTFGPLTILFFIICRTDTWSTKNFFQCEFYAMISHGCPSQKHMKHFIYVKHSACQIMNVLYSLLLSERDTFFSWSKDHLRKFQAGICFLICPCLTQILPKTTATINFSSYLKKILMIDCLKLCQSWLEEIRLPASAYIESL